MKRTFLSVVLLLATSASYSASPSIPEVPPVGADLGLFFERFSLRQAVSDFKVDVKAFLGKKSVDRPSDVDGGFAGLEGVGSLPHAGAFPEIEKAATAHKALFIEKGKAADSALKASPALYNTPGLNGGFGDLESFDGLPSASHEGAIGTKVEQAQNYIKSLFAPKPAAAVEQKRKSLLTQISENPGTTAALTAGTVVALYGSYKLIQYFDKKKARSAALAKRLKAQRMQSLVVFE